MIYFITPQLQVFEPIGRDAIAVQTTLDYLFARFRSTTHLAVDTETTGLFFFRDKVLSLQIGDAQDQFVIDVQNIDIKVLKEFLESKTLLMQNAKFDLKFLFNYGIYPTQIIDTYLQEEVKEVRSYIHKEGLTARVIIYGANDVKYLHAIARKQRKRLVEDKLTIAAALENQFVFSLAYIEYSGIYLDKTKWSEKQKIDNINLKTSELTLNNWIIENLPSSNWIDAQLDLFSSEKKVNINWNSPKQVIKLFKDLGINTETKDAKGELSNSVEAPIIKPQEGKFPIIKPYLKYKQCYKVVSTYGDNFINQINPGTGRIHTSFRQLMDTGRLSSGEKKMGSINLQNIPADKPTRTCFTSQFDWSTLINADYSGQEQIILANFTKEKNLLEFYEKDLGDMHSFIAGKIYKELSHLPLEEIKKLHPDKRQNAKSAGFAINYGGNGSTIADNLNISEEEGDFVYDAYFEAFPDLKGWFDSVQSDTISKGYVLINNVTNRRSYIPFFEEFKVAKREVDQYGFWSNYRQYKKEGSAKFHNYYKPLVKRYFKMIGIMERRALNYRIQGTASEVTKIACIKFMKEILSRNLFNIVKISNVVHDEILVECPKIMAESISVLLKKCMEDAGDVFCKIVPLKAVPVISDSWQH